ALICRLGRRVTIAGVVGLGLTTGLGLGTKASAAMLIPMALALLLVRAIWWKTEWKVLGRPLVTGASRAGAGVGITVAVALIADVTLWAAYDFRFAPTADDAVRLDNAGAISITRLNELMAAHPDRQPTGEEVADWKPDLTIQAVEFADEHRLLPHAW